MRSVYQKTIDSMKAILGLIDILTLGKIRNCASNHLVFHEISDNPSQLSQMNSTTLDLKSRDRILSHFLDRKFISSGYLRNIYFTFDDGFRNTLSTIEALCARNIPVIVFLNAATILTGVNRDIERIYSSSKASWNSLSLNLLQGHYFTQEDIENLSHYKNVKFGDHLYEHVSARNIDEAKFKDYLSLSLQFFSDLRIEIDSFAWPYGDERVDFIESAKSKGIRKIYKGSLRFPQKFDETRLPRVQVSNRPLLILHTRGSLLLNRFLTKK